LLLHRTFITYLKLALGLLVPIPSFLLLLFFFSYSPRTRVIFRSLAFRPGLKAIFFLWFPFPPRHFCVVVVRLLVGRGRGICCWVVVTFFARRSFLPFAIFLFFFQIGLQGRLLKRKPAEQGLSPLDGCFEALFFFPFSSQPQTRPNHLVL